MIGGIDYDTNRVALCALSNDGARTVAMVHTQVYRAKKVDAFDSIRSAFGEMYDLVAARFPAVDPWWIEHAFGANRSVDFKLGRVQGALIAAIPPDLTVKEVGPPQWKKALGLNGNAGKAAYVPIVRKMVAGWRFENLDGVVLPNESLNEHELDAWCVARYGQTVRT